VTRRAWFCLGGVLAILVFALGVWGFTLDGPLHRDRDPAYAALQMFFLNVDFEQTCADQPAAEPPCAENDQQRIVLLIARYGAAVVALSAVGSVVLRLFRNPVSHFLAERQRNHVVVAGSRPEVLALASSFVDHQLRERNLPRWIWLGPFRMWRKGVVAVVSGWDGAKEPPRGVRVVHLAGSDDVVDALFASRFTKVANRAKRLVVLDDGVGGPELLDAAIHAGNPPERIHVGIDDGPIANRLHTAEIVRGRRFDVFSTTRRAVSRVLSEFNPDSIAELGEELPEVVVVCVGTIDAAEHFAHRIEHGWGISCPPIAAGTFGAGPSTTSRRTLVFVSGGPDEDGQVIAEATRLAEGNHANRLVIVGLTHQRTHWTSDLTSGLWFHLVSVDDVLASCEHVTFDLACQLAHFGPVRAGIGDDADLSYGECAVADLFARWVRPLEAPTAGPPIEVPPELAPAVVPEAWWLRSAQPKDDAEYDDGESGNDADARAVGRALARCGVWIDWRAPSPVSRPGVGAVEPPLPPPPRPQPVEVLARQVAAGLEDLWTVDEDGASRPLGSTQIEGMLAALVGPDALGGVIDGLDFETSATVAPAVGRAMFTPAAVVALAARLHQRIQDEPTLRGIGVDQCRRVVWALPEAQWRCGRGPTARSVDRLVDSVNATLGAGGDVATVYLSGSSAPEAEVASARKLTGRARRRVSDVERLAFALWADYDAFERLRRRSPWSFGDDTEPASILTSARDADPPDHWGHVARWRWHLWRACRTNSGRDPVSNRHQACVLLLSIALASTDERILEVTPRRRGAVATAWTEDELDPMCRREHDRWFSERTRQGYVRPARTNVDTKRSDQRVDPGLVVWKDLFSDEQRGRDARALNVRRTVHTFAFLPRILRSADLELTAREVAGDGQSGGGASA